MQRIRKAPRVLRFRAFRHRARLRPDWFGKVTPATIRSDLLAGLTGATIVLPQGVAFAAIAGLPAEYGFYTAMVTPVVAALTGSSWHAVSGPTTAISALVFGALSGHFVPGSQEFIQAAVLLALIVGLIQLALGLARLGALVDFVSHSVMTGFVTGAALLIALSQIGGTLSLSLPRPEALGAFAVGLWRALPGANLSALAIACVALATGWGIKWWRPRWPNYLIALAVATLACLGLGGTEAGIATIGSVSGIVPYPDVPVLSGGMLRDLGSAAVAIALVGLLEAMSVARAIALRSGQTIDSNREFIGQGLSNTVGSFFQCYPASASFTRSAVNYDAGAQTPLSAIFAALFLLLILLLVAPWFSYVPIPAMAGVILLVAWRLIDFAEIRHILATSPSEAVIAGVTLAATLLIDLEFAIYAGVMLSLLVFLQKTARPKVIVSAPDPETPSRMFRNTAIYPLPECPQMMIARLDGPLYFGSLEHIRREFRRFEEERPQQKHMMLVANGVEEIDMPGVDLLLEEARRRKRRGGSFYLLTRRPRMISKLARIKALRTLTKRHFFLSKHDAVAAAVPTLDQHICAGCRARIFKECPALTEQPAALESMP